MNKLFEQTFKEWTGDRNALQARINIYRHVRDIPYAVVPELNDSVKYCDILKLQRGSCTPKHLLLGDMFQRLDLEVRYVVYSYVRGGGIATFPVYLRQMLVELPPARHFACKVEIDGRFVLVDATLDSPLKKMGWRVNEDWDGTSDTILPINPCGEEELYHPSEVPLMKVDYTEPQLSYYREFNRWLDEIRKR